MVAPSRSRLFAFGFSALLVLSILPGFVPSVAADDPTVTFTSIRFGTNPDAGPTLKIGDRIYVNATGTINGSPCIDQPGLIKTVNGTATVDLSGLLLGATAASEPMDVSVVQQTTNTQATPYAFTLTKSFLLSEVATNGLNGGSTGNRVISFTAECRYGNGDTIVTRETMDAPQTGPTENALSIDNVRPSIVGTLSAASGTIVRVGSTFDVRFTNPVDVVSSTLDLRQFTTAFGAGGTRTSLGNPADVLAETLQDTGTDAPTGTITVRDAAGNDKAIPLTVAAGHAFDAKSPPASTVGTTSTSTSVSVTMTTTDTDVTHHEVTLVRSGSGATPTLVNVPRATTAHSFAGLVKNASYDVTVTPVDDAGNRGPTSSISRATLQVPSGKFTLTVVPGTGTGGIGTEYEIALSDLDDVKTVTVDVSAFSDSVIAWTAGSDHASVRKGVVSSRPSASTAAPTASFVSESGIVGAGTFVNGAPAEFPFDAKAPSAVATPRAYAATGGFIDVAFAPTDNDILRYEALIRPAGASTFSVVALGASTGTIDGMPTYRIPASSYTSNVEQEVRVRAIDNKNNVGAETASFFVTPSATPTPTVAIDAATDTTLQNFGSISGTWALPERIGADADALSFQLKSGANYWNGAAFVATVQDRPLTNPQGAAGAFTIAELVGKTFTEGTYTLTVRNRDPYSGVATTTAPLTFQIDRTLPVAKTGTGDNAYVTDVAAGVMQAQGTIDLKVNYADTGGTGLASVKLEILDAGAPVATIVCPGTPGCVSVSPPIGGQSYDGVLTIRPPSLPMKSGYTLRVTVTDLAGNPKVEPRATPAIAVVPRATLAESDDLPFADATGILLSIYAAFDGTSTVVPDAPCPPSNACRVSKIEVLARNRTGSEATSAGRVLKTIDIPYAGPAKLVAGSDALYYDYSPLGRISANGLDINNSEIRVVATVVLPGDDAPTAQGLGPWVRLRTGEAPAGLFVRGPLDDTNVSMDGAPGTVGFNVLFEQSGLESVPTMNYTIRVLADPTTPANVGKYLRIDGTGAAVFSATPPSPPVTVALSDDDGDFANNGGTYWFNWTNTRTMPRGEYLLNATAVGAAGATRSVQRFFAVESVSPTIAVDVDQPEIFNDRYVRREFNVSMRVDHGLANLSASGLTVRLVAQNAGGGTRTLLPNLGAASEGFTATLRDVDAMEGNVSTLVNWTIKLPTNATDSAAYDLRFNATTGSFRGEESTKANATRLLTVSFDNATPTGSVSAAATNATGRVLGDPLKIVGAASDAGVTGGNGAGVGKVEVRVFNVTGNSTFVWNATDDGVFAAGFRDSWLSSDLMPIQGNASAFVRNVLLTKPTSSWAWTIDAGTRLRLAADGSSHHQLAGVFEPWDGGRGGFSGTFVGNEWRTGATQAIDGTLTGKLDGCYRTSIDITCGLFTGVFAGNFTGAFTPPVTADAASSTSTRALSGVVNGTFDGTIAFEAIPLDRYSVYRVETRVTDNVGHVTTTAPVTVRFDPDAPVLVDQGVRAGGVQGPATLDYRATPLSGAPRYAEFGALVRDNHCLKAVTLVGKAPSGAQFEAPMTRPATAVCSPTSGNANANWTVNITAQPQLASEVGSWSYWVKATDFAGHESEIPLAQRTLRINVIDTFPAQITSLSLEPPIVGAGTSSRVLIGIRENQGVERIDVSIFREGSGGQLTLVGSSLARPLNATQIAANGTGMWLADTSEDLDADLEVGRYTVVVRPRDVNAATTCAGGCPEGSIVLRVDAEAAPAVALESPASAGGFVGADPVFRVRVLDRAIATSGIAASLSAAGAPVNVSTSFQEIRVAGALAGYTVTIRPNASLPDTDDLELGVSARSGTGRTNATEFAFKVDGTPPVVAHAVKSDRVVGGQSYAVDATRINLSASDARSGLASLKYSVNGGVERVYTGELAKPDAATRWSVEYVATDAAGNVREGNVTLHVDEDGPTITVLRHGDDLLLQVADAGAGVDVDEVRVLYAYGDAELAEVEAKKETGNAFRALLGGNASATGLKYHIEAADLLGNIGGLYGRDAPHVIPKSDGVIVVPPPPPINGTNEPPTLDVLSPKPNDRVRQTMNVSWSATDPEGKPVSVRVAVKNGASLLDELPANGSRTLDLRRFAAGPTTLIFVADDGEKIDTVEVTISVESGQVVSSDTPPPPTATVDQPVQFRVSIKPIDRTVRSATYVLYRDNAEYARGELTASAAGIYAGQVVPRDPGNYDVFVLVNYESGAPDPLVKVGSFAVAGTVASGLPAMPVSFIVLLVLAGITIALAAGGAFGRWRK